MNQTLFNRLKTYSKENIYPFHMPGHKRRLSPEEAAGIYEMDITEIDGFDYLHEASDILLDAQEFAARLYHSEETRFVVNGSTAGLLAAISAVCRSGDKIMVARNCHKAVYHALEINHLKPIYIYPHINREYGINEGINPQDIEDLLRENQDIKAIVITSPTYDGLVSDVEKICKLAHANTIPVIIDEAHGAHFNFSEYFPDSAVSKGADIVIQSVHKTLPAMTQTSIIHINGDIVKRERIRKMLAVYQSSSPSYILMGSIDSCMHMLHEHGDALYDVYTENLDTLRHELAACKHIRLFEKEDMEMPYSVDYDRSKILLSVKNTSMTGQMLHKKLLQEYGLQMEMVSSDYVLAMTSVGDDKEGYDRLVQAVREIDREISKMEKSKNTDSATLPRCRQLVDLYEAGWMEMKDIVYTDAKNKISSSYIYLYPPGIPLVTPGEEINEEVIHMISFWLKSDMDVSGIEEKDGNYWVKVISDENI